MHVHELKNNAKEASLEEDKRVLVIEAYKEVRDTCKDIQKRRERERGRIVLTLKTLPKDTRKENKKQKMDDKVERKVLTAFLLINVIPLSQLEIKFIYMHITNFIHG